MTRKLLIGLLAVLFAGHAMASIRVVATVPNMGMLAEAIGGDSVEVTVLAPPDRDPHYLEARPSMMAALRRADLVVAIGAELEVGWLPAALQGAHNPSVREGRLGYFEGANHTRLIRSDDVADRALGDVHVTGNPHYYFDPIRMAEVGHALAERLSQLDPDRLEHFRSNADAFEKRAREHVARWQEMASGSTGLMLYHKDADYLGEMLEVDIIGYIEPLPGIPPTGRHLNELVNTLRGQEGVILYSEFQPSQGPEFLARELGWQHHSLPNQVAIGADMNDYFEMLERWVRSLSH